MSQKIINNNSVINSSISSTQRTDRENTLNKKKNR